MEQISKRLMNWASILEDKTREQAVMASTMPFIHPHLALMPDAHLGKGATVGSVIPTLGAIIPAAVGVDIGCGMMAVRTTHQADDLPTDRSSLHAAISKAVPLSAGKYNETLYSDSTKERITALEAMDGYQQRRPSRQTGASSSARSDRATTSSRSAWTRTITCGFSCTRDRAGWATNWR